MRESIINKFLWWLTKRSVTALYKRTRFLIFSWGLDENTDLYLISEESYHDRHRFGLHEEKYDDTPQNDCESCEHKHEMGLPCYHCPIAVDCGWR